LKKENIYSSLEILCKEAIIKAGKISIDLQKKLNVKYKSENQPVTNADIEINEFLKKYFKELTPQYGWLSEESIDDNSRNKLDSFWCLDPIDGTRSYIYGKPEFTISLALITNDRPVLGFIYNPITEEFFFAKHKYGSFCNEKKIFVNKKTDINNSSIAASNSEIKRLEKHSFFKMKKIKKMGSIAYKIALVAKGEIDIAISFTKKNDWDIAAADLILTEAGGEIKSISEGKIIYNTKNLMIDSVIASNNALVGKLKEKLE
jgi:myo-inositol-1(or 4)-monophosphatase